MDEVRAGKQKRILRLTGITIGVYLDEVLRILNAPGHELEESEAAALEERIADLAEEQETLLNQLDVNLE